MSTRVLNKKFDEIPSDAVYIGRPSKWGNQFVIGVDGNRDEVIELHAASITPEQAAEARAELAGRDLVCFCAPMRCHGDTWLRVANENVGGS